MEPRAATPCLVGLKLAATLAVAASLLPGVQAQGGDYGFGGGGYNPPAPICKPFTCPSGQKAVGKPGYQVWSYGCKDSGMNIFNAGSFDPNNPLGGQMKQKSVDKCCIERDICKQTCGMTSKACHDNFQKCSAKICKGDQNCQLQAMMSEIMSEPYEEKEDYGSTKYDPKEQQCKGYKRGQSDSCMCVPKDDFKSSTENTLKEFYGRFNKEKLNKKGEIKDVDEVWKKWKGKEPDMFLALTTKYKEKAVDRRVKPKPPPYKPPKDAAEGGSDEAESPPVEEDETAAPTPPPPPSTPTLDEEDRAFEDKKAELDRRKRQAAKEEDYDVADQTKEEAATLQDAEMTRLKARKAKAIEEEDYAEAKRVKLRLAQLSGEL